MHFQRNSALHLLRIDLFAVYDLIFIPINQNDIHWTLAVINLRNKQLEFYDSMGKFGLRFLNKYVPQEKAHAMWDVGCRNSGDAWGGRLGGWMSHFGRRDIKFTRPVCRWIRVHLCAILQVSLDIILPLDLTIY